MHRRAALQISASVHYGFAEYSGVTVWLRNRICSYRRLKFKFSYSMLQRKNKTLSPRTSRLRRERVSPGAALTTHMTIQNNPKLVAGVDRCRAKWTLAGACSTKAEHRQMYPALPAQSRPRAAYQERNAKEAAVQPMPERGEEPEKKEQKCVVS